LLEYLLFWGEEKGEKFFGLGTGGAVVMGIEMDII